ncbi:MAG: MotA/TolQ/ExbB proton channel family protein [Vampirovibrio sp.]|nr:MotA/TolQ/ExbB proton channel family protein [Vampirovibrio sp.]
MDITTILGFGLGIAILVVSLLMGNIPLKALMNPEAILIVFGGTATAVLISFSTNTLKDAYSGAKGCFYRDSYTPELCVGYLNEISVYVRQQGMLALVPLIHRIEIPFLKTGLRMMVDNRSIRHMREKLSTEIEVSYRKELEYATVFEYAGGFSPTMGIIGAVIGLIHTVAASQDAVQMGQGVAQAFSATLYGVALANLFLLPLAGKLKQRAREECFKKTLMMEGMISIQAEDHPIVTEEKLKAFIHEEPSVTSPRQARINNRSLPAVGSTGKQSMPKVVRG